MPPRLVLLTPFAFPSVRGNAVTVDRIVAGLRAHGVDLRVLDVSVTPQAEVAAEVEAFRPSLVHAFHAYRVGPQALRLARRLEVPLVVTLTGTDVNYDLFDPDRASVVRRILEGAATLVAFHSSIAERILSALPDLRGRLRIVPQAAHLPAGEPFDLDARWRLPEGRVLFVLPAGIRPVKRPTLPLAPLGRLVARRPQVRLLYAGPVLDPEEGEALLRQLAHLPWARHVGAVPHRQMASLLQQADVMLNCSESEGGMANSVLEAMAVGRAVLASDIEGNRSVVEDGVTGLLFRDERDLEAAAERLAGDAGLRRRLGAAARAMVTARYPAEAEIESYLDIYRRLVPVPSA
jgi:glycosyltransferase involved in cell wall biosynthesis